MTLMINDIADVINISVSNPAESEYDIFVGLEHYDVGEPIITRYGSTKMLTTACKKFSAGDILLARRNVYLRRAGLVKFDGLTSGDSIVIRIKPNLSIEGVNSQEISRLLPFVLNTNAFWDFANTNSDGTMSKRLSPQMLLSYEFNLPPYSNQKPLADKLWAAYNLKASKLKLIDAIDEMVKSQFIEMFGTLDSPSKCQKISVAEAVRSGIIDKPLDGNHGSKHPKASEYVNSGVPFLMANDFNDGKVDLTQCTFITRERALKLDKGFAKEGDVLLTHKGTVGKTAILHCPGYDFIMLTPQVTYYRPKKGISAEYLKAYFDSKPFQEELQNIASSGSTRAYIGIVEQQKLHLLIPSVEDQMRFTKISKQADKSKFELKKSIEAIDKVIKSLINNI